AGPWTINGQILLGWHRDAALQFKRGFSFDNGRADRAAKGVAVLDIDGAFVDVQLSGELIGGSEDNCSWPCLLNGSTGNDGVDRIGRRARCGGVEQVACEP